MFDPIVASEEIKNSYIDYITTSFDIADKEYARLFRKELEKEGSTAKGPYLDIGGSYETGHTLRELIDSEVASPLFAELEPIPEKERELKLERPLYSHQEEALIKASRGQSLVVTTGTGSGKTESFLMPILQHIFTEIENGTLNSGVRAIIIYPMNALANDQIKRMRTLLKNYPKITFGIYNGNTEHTHREALGEYHKTHKDADGNPLEPLENELISREEMQNDPPHILITNYSMLEYMMLRPKDDAVFSGAKLKYIVLDEAHIYKGATGMETSLLMRRLRARISEPDSVQYILTSATLGGKDADPDILNFAKKLSGVTFLSDSIIRSRTKQPGMLGHLSVDPQLFSELNDHPNQTKELLSNHQLDFSPEGTDEERLYSLFLHLELFSALRRLAGTPVTVTQLLSGLREIDPGITRKQVVDLINVCAKAEFEGANLIKPRYHFFVRALEGAYISLAEPKQLFLTRQTQCDSFGEEKNTVFEMAVCNDCGRIAVVGNTEGGFLVQSARKGVEDFAEYYLVRSSGDKDFFEDDDADEDELDQIENDGSHDFVLCPICGAIAPEADLHFDPLCDHDPSKYIRLRYIEPAKSGKANCPVCGYGSFRRFYVGSEAATGVLGTELFEQMPTEIITETEEKATSGGLFARSGKKITRKSQARQFLCFSDSRSEAAYFAVYMERSYQEFLRRRGIWQTAEKLKSRGITRISVTGFVNELARYYEAKGSFSNWEKPNAELTSVSQQNAWIAILNEMFNARRATGLVTMGRIAFTYRANSDFAENVSLEYPILSKDEALSLLDQLVQDAVFSGAIDAGKEFDLNGPDREYIFFTQYPKYLKKVKLEKSSTITGWCGRKRTNGKGGYYPNTRISRLKRALEISDDEADFILGGKDDVPGYWDGVFHPETETFVLDANDFDILIGGTDAVHFYRCSRCGRITPYNVRGLCSSVKCDGHLEPYEPLEHVAGNHYAKLYMGEQMSPLFIKEHTAQLAKDQQTKYQEAFVNKQIHALSCSTTFEMGVDVGSLETVYLRDVPPSPANYVQRAGRAGRSKGSAAYVLTYAKLSSHDFTYYDEPEQLISGKISAPVFEVENEKIIYRHIFAVAISAFFAENPDVYYSDNQTVFLNQDGYERFCSYISERPEHLRTLLKNSIPENMHRRLGIDDWSWFEYFCGEDGVLKLAVDDFKNTVEELERQQRDAHKRHDDEAAGNWQRTLRNFRCADEDNAGKKSLISFFVRNNVLPKYGFPVDTVELLPEAYGKKDGKELQLARDLQMAIADYAPGAQVVADGKLYTSRYIRKSPGKNAGIGWEIGYFCAKCPNPGCGQPNFYKGSVGKSQECVSCHKPINYRYWEKTLEPRLGFVADVKTSEVPLHKPEHDYKTDDVYIGDPQRNVILEKEFSINGKVVKIASTSNDSLVVVGQSTFHVCQTCGYAEEGKFPLEHKNMQGYPCKNKDGKNIEYRLSHDFKTDVARITFADQSAGDYKTMVSVLYALLEGLSREMDIERTDIKGCLFRTSESGMMLYSVILYDAVAGGAGHVRRLVTEDGAALQRVLKRACAVVENCDCGSSCYKCLRNYYNQKIHDDLDRYLAAAFLREWIGEMGKNDIPSSKASSAHDTQRTNLSATPVSVQPERLLDAMDVDRSDPYDENDWDSLYFMFDDSARDTISQMETANIPLPEYISTTVRRGRIKGEIIMSWPTKNVLIFGNEISEEDKNTCIKNGWHWFDLSKIDLTLLKEVLS